VYPGSLAVLPLRIPVFIRQWSSPFGTRDIPRSTHLSTVAKETLRIQADSCFVDDGSTRKGHSWLLILITSRQDPVAREIPDWRVTLVR
jgi:hypothetical protein